ncbi:alpha/beta fold hydrolase [Alkalilimnicola sp. S0819]|uniref:alpha/beta fold hydrolase n=1 Tax=Alkalilimnicola sp. S0819 TaxID=2613922 RepID=UPI00126286F1|nr:alpha/beta hydrolase [Alkalilimnicola sp. S0819]KAB7628192.1 alpha/beta hydrolase [Alkalilimnicola sp. S0819]MPQ15081.1 alpha/beta fold hydrolase [Alkalilimnicola sp. S0819]
MPYFKHQGHPVYYELGEGAPDAPTLVMVNGLTQATRHWAPYQQTLADRGIRLLSFDLLGQGESAKPVLGLEFEDNVAVLESLLDHLGLERAYVAGISFGGIVALKFAIEHPERCAGLIPMSTFSEMDARLRAIGGTLYQGMARVGFEYLVELFTSYNFSAQWLERHAERIPEMRRQSSAGNQLYAIQNLMESIARFQGFTAELARITAPTLILNGEHDALTPRSCHEILRQHIAGARLVLLPHVAHAFTLEVPEICTRIWAEFIEAVEAGRWEGDQSVWVAAENAEAEPLLSPCSGDHTRAIPV